MKIVKLKKKKIKSKTKFNKPFNIKFKICYSFPFFSPDDGWLCACVNSHTTSFQQSPIPTGLGPIKSAHSNNLTYSYLGIDY